MSWLQTDIITVNWRWFEQCLSTWHGKKKSAKKKKSISRSLVYSSLTPEGTWFICTNNSTNGNRQTAQGRRRLTDESTFRSISKQQVQPYLHPVTQSPSWTSNVTQQGRSHSSETTLPNKVQPLRLHTGTKILLSGETLALMLFFRTASCCGSRNEEGSDVDLLKQ